MSKKPSLFLALLPIVFTISVLGIQFFLFKNMTPHIPLFIGIAFTGCLGLYLKQSWRSLESGMYDVIKIALPSVSILICVGITISVWIASGTVPSLIYFGLKLISPSLFLPIAVLVCALVSVSLGTSWGTTGTIGLALMGIGEGFGIPMYWTAGAIVSGAFFGDKISPLSDTTNLAPAVTGTTVFDHIKNMLPTTIPAMIIALIIYTICNLFYLSTGDVSSEKISLLTQTLDTDFIISLWCLLPAAIVCFLAVKKVPPLPSLFAGIVSGTVFAVFLQGNSISNIMKYAFTGFEYTGSVEALTTLLNRGGVQSMSWAILLIIFALGFGGILEKIGCMEKILSSIISKLKTFAQLQTSAILCAAGINIVAGDPYLSIALPGRLFKDAYIKKGYSPLNLARAVEEGGTLISPLIPWNSGGVFVITALGLNVFDGNIQNLLYIPLAFACWISPLLGITYAYFGWFSPKLEK
jgi:Na+:H+ antiporter, NhaC family